MSILALLLIYFGIRYLRAKRAQRDEKFVRFMRRVWH